MIDQANEALHEAEEVETMKTYKIRYLVEFIFTSKAQEEMDAIMEVRSEGTISDLIHHRFVESIEERTCQIKPVETPEIVTLNMFRPESYEQSQQEQPWVVGKDSVIP